LGGFFSAATFFGREATPGFAGPDFVGFSTRALAGAATANFSLSFARVLAGVAKVLVAVLVGLGMCSLR
jgi:hypothetical protein